MRKVISLLLCVAMLCSLVVITAQADATPAADFADVVAVPGGTVTVDVKLTNNPGLTALRFTFTNTIGATYSMEDIDDDFTLTANDGGGKYLWNNTNGVNLYNTTFGKLTITIPANTPAGDYTFTVVADQGASESGKVDLDSDTFTVTVTDKVITGVNIAIDTGLAIGVHVVTADIDNTSITAVNVAGAEFTTIEDYEEGEDGDYIFYLNVNPWAMDAEFKVDFTENFVIDGDELDLDQIPATAKTTGILKYCEKLLTMDPSEELVQLLADMLAFGQAAQTYQGVAVMELPAGLTPTEAEWVDGEDNPCDFGTYCAENFSTEFAKGNSTAAKKFKFDEVKIEFGATFKATFTFANNGTTTAFSNARVKVNGDTLALDGQTLEYAFTPMDCAGVEFVLYASTTSFTATNKCYTTTYGPSHYAAYLNDQGVDALDLFEAYYNYGVSAEAYAATLSE